MKSSSLILLSLLFFAPAFGQVIDTSELKKLEGGQYRIEPGKIQVTFVDTVTLPFMQAKISELRYEVFSHDFQNILLSVTKSPTPEQLKEIEENELVELVMSQTSSIKQEDLEHFAKIDSVSGDKVKQMLEKMQQGTNYAFIFVTLTEKATAADADRLIAEYPELKMRMLRENYRTAVIKTEPGKAPEAMDELNVLSFVKNTAYIGTIE